MVFTKIQYGLQRPVLTPHSGSQLAGYGNLVLIRHDERFITAYTHNSKNVAKENDSVSKGQLIAYMGGRDVAGDARARLHFEMRLNGIVIDPLRFLPGEENQFAIVVSIDASRSQCMGFGFDKEGADLSNCILQLEIMKKKI
jgi:hypothetical protein